MTLIMEAPAYIVEFEKTELALDRAAVEDIFVTKLAENKAHAEGAEPAEEGLWDRFRTWVLKGK